MIKNSSCVQSKSIFTVKSKTGKTDYEDVKTKLDTGLTKKNVILLTNHQVAKKKSEIFKRISAKKLYSLIEEEEKAMK